LRHYDKRRLRVVDHRRDPVIMGEPLARAVRSALDALGWKPADAARATGLSSQHLSQILNRKKPYGSRPPSASTQQALEKIPGLSHLDIARALGESTGIGRLDGQTTAVEMTATRRAVHNLVDKLSEEQLPRALQVLIAMFD
jgi:transcriptional regulator with XRE-family HTH domain